MILIGLESSALSGLNYITSVSGGSILAAHLVLNWSDYTDFRHPSKFDSTASQLIDFIQSDVRGSIVRRLPFNFPFYVGSTIWRLSPLRRWNVPRFLRKSTTDSLERRYEKKLFPNAKLDDLRSFGGIDRPKLYMLATDLASEVSDSYFCSRGFTSDHFYADETLPLAKAVAASSAFPGLFPAMNYMPPGENRIDLKLSDGGIYDNLGVRKFWDLLKSEVPLNEIILSDTSLRFRSSFGSEFLEPFTIPIKATDILMRRVYELERDEAGRIDKRFPNCNFKFLRLREEVQYKEDCFSIPRCHQKCLHLVRTDLDEFSDVEIAALVRHGYLVAQKILQYRLPSGVHQSDIPVWDPVPNTCSSAARSIVHPAKRNPIDLAIATSELERSSKRKKRLISISDPIPTATLAILVSLCVWASWNTYDSWRFSQKNQTIKELEKEKANQEVGRSNLQELAASFAPNDLNGKWIVPLETIDVSDDNAFTDALGLVSKARKKGFAQVLIFKLKADNESNQEFYAYRPSAVFDDERSAFVGMEKAIKEINVTANEIKSVDSYCRNAKYRPEKGVFDCTTAAPDLERRGFVMILNGNLADAITDFELANETSPQIHNAYEISRFLRVQLAGADSSQVRNDDQFLRSIRAIILKEYSWGMPEDIKREFAKSVEEKP